MPTTDDDRMKIVIIGLGYSAGFFARAAQAQGHGRSSARSAAAEKARGADAGRACRRWSSTASRSRRALAAAVRGGRGRAGLDAAGRGRRPGSRLPRRGAGGGAALRWIGYLSTIGVYGDHGGAWIDETPRCRPSQRPRPDTAPGHRREPGSPSASASGKPVQIFRLSGIYGPGRNAIVNLREGTARRLVKPGQVFNRIHVDDIAGVLLASLERPRAGAIYNVTDDEPAPPQDVVSYAAALIGVTPPPEIPYDPAQLSPMAASFYSQNKRVSNALVKRELGYGFRYPTYREALTALAAERANRSPGAKLDPPALILMRPAGPSRRRPRGSGASWSTFETPRRGSSGRGLSDAGSRQPS